MYKCSNPNCTIHQRGKIFPAAMDCPLCDTPLVRELTLTAFQQEVVNTYPYVIAYPYKRMLDEPTGRQQLELLAFTFVNALKYVGLITASEYFNATIRSPKLNELFRDNLYRPSFGNWNHFIREAIKELTHLNHSWIFPEVMAAYENIETGKKAKKYKTKFAFTNEDGLMDWRDAMGTAIGTLINFRNRYLGHGVPLQTDMYGELYRQHLPILEELLNGMGVVAKIPMYKSDRFHSYLLTGLQVKEMHGLKVGKGTQYGDVWLQENNRVLPLLPFFMLPGAFAEMQGKGELFVYDQNTSSRLVFYSPEGVEAETAGEVLQRLNILLLDKEKHPALTTDTLSKEAIQEQANINNAKVLHGLIREKKVIEGVYQNRQDAEVALKSWIGANRGLLVIASQAGSGKTNLLNYMVQAYQERSVTTLLLRATRLVSTHFETMVKQALNIAEELPFSNVYDCYTQADPLMVLLDGLNEHPQALQLFNSLVEFLQEYAGGKIKVVVSWRADSVEELPVIAQAAAVLYEAEKHEKQTNPIAQNALVLKPLNKQELKAAWDFYVAYPAKLYKPNFTLEELTLQDRLLSDQLANPLLLRMFLELFNKKSLKQKGEGFTDIWELWWKSIAANERQAAFLKEFALLVLNTNGLQVDLDVLHDHPVLGAEVRNIQVDSAFEQLVNKGVLTTYFKDGELMVGFTMEAALHYTLSRELVFKQSDVAALMELLQGNNKWEEPIKYYLLHLVNTNQLDIVFRIIDEVTVAAEVVVPALAQMLATKEVEVVIAGLAKSLTDRDLQLLVKAIERMEKAQQKIRLKEIIPAIFEWAQGVENNALLLLTCFDYLEVEGREKVMESLADISKEINSKEGADLLSEYARVLKDIGKYNEALVLRKKILDWKLKNTPDNWNAIAGSYSNIGSLYNLQGEFVKALDCHEKSLELKRKKYGQEYITLATSYNNIGVVYVEQGEYVKSLEYYEKALLIRKKFYGEEHPAVAASYNNIGFVYDSIGEYAKALEYYEKALLIAKKFYGVENPTVANSYCNIGSVYDSLGYYAKALEYYEKALLIEKKFYGEEHPNVATSYNNIGCLYASKGEFENALKFCEKSLLIFKKNYGEEHPAIAKSYNNIGGVYDSLGDYAKALEYYEKDLAISIKFYREEHPNVATSYNNIGGVYYSKGEYDLTFQYYEKGLLIFKKIYGEEHPDVATSYSNIGVIYKTKGEYPKALEYYEKALLIRKKFYGEEHPDVATSYGTIGVVYDSLGEYTKALEYYEIALLIRKKFYGEEHPDVALSYYNLGNVYNKMANIETAKQYFDKCLQIRLKFLGEEHEDTKTVIDELNKLGDK